MTFRFLYFGKPREDYLILGIREYEKRLSKYGKVVLESLPEERLSGRPSEGEIAAALEKEARRASLRLKEGEALLVADVHAPLLSSSSFQDRIDSLTARRGMLVFLFGSSYGLSDSLRKRADFLFSLSPLTFTHYQALLLTLEQVYRTEKSLHGETYDK